MNKLMLSETLAHPIRNRLSGRFSGLVNATTMVAVLKAGKASSILYPFGCKPLAEMMAKEFGQPRCQLKQIGRFPTRKRHIPN